MYFIDSSSLAAMPAPEQDGEIYAQRLDSSHGNAASGSSFLRRCWPLCACDTYPSRRR